MPARIPRHGLTRIIEAMEMNPGHHLVPAETAAGMALVNSHGAIVAYPRDERTVELLESHSDLVTRLERAGDHGVWHVSRHRRHKLPKTGLPGPVAQSLTRLRNHGVFRLLAPFALAFILGGATATTAHLLGAHAIVVGLAASAAAAAGATATHPAIARLRHAVTAAWRNQRRKEARRARAFRDATGSMA